MAENDVLVNVEGEVEVEGAGAANNINELNEENVERVEGKLDRTLLYINGIKELPFLIQIMTILELEPGLNLDITNRRSVNRALLRFLNDRNEMK